MRYIYVFLTVSLLLFSCKQLEYNDDYGVAISDLENRVAELNNQISSLNLDINRLDARINSQLDTIKFLSDSASKLENNNLNQIDSLVLDDVQIIDPEILFKDTYRIKTLSVLTCSFINMNTNSAERYYKEEEIEIDYNNGTQIYQILEINKTRRYIKVYSINYDLEFNVYTLDQE